MTTSPSPSRRPRTPLATSLLIALLAAVPASLAQTGPTVDARDRSLPAQARGVAMGGLLRVDQLRLESEAGPARLDLERFRVFSTDAQIVLDDSSVVAPPDTAYFRGFVDGDAASIAILSVPRGGGAHGLVARGGSLWTLTAEAGGALRTRKVDIATELAPLMEDFECGSDGLPAVPGRLLGALSPDAAVDVVPAAGPSYTARVAVETDFEFYALKGQSVSNALGYLGDLFAFASTIYENEVATNLLVSYVSLWTQGASADPWTATSGTSAALSEYRSFWNSNRTGVPRTISHMLSGKGLGGGIAYIGVLCNSTYGYGLSASLNGSFNIDNPQSVWDIIVVSHEIGHNFNSPHTHDYCNIGGNSEPVDACVPSQYGPACNGVSGQLPLGCPGPGQYCGTIMSYCHLISGGYGNIGLTFGLGHPYGVEPGRVPERMYASVVANGACLGYDGGGPRLTVEVIGDGQVTMNPPGSVCEDYCEQDYDSGAAVTLTPSSSSGASFIGWTGDADCSDGSVTVTAATHCIATFGDNLCGNGQIDGNEECDGTDIGAATCPGTCAGPPTCTSSCTLDYSTCTDGFCDTAAGEDCAGCAADCVTGGGAVCGNGVCEAGLGEDCVSCPTDCDGKQNGKPSGRWCCGNGGTGSVGCSDPRCSDEPGESCSTAAAVEVCCGDGTCQSGEPNAAICDVNDCSGGGPVCGDGVCDAGEDSTSCPADCPPPSVCGDGVCDADEDATTCPADCSGGVCVNPGGAADGDACSSDAECCSNKCRGKRNEKVCRAA